MSSNTSSTQRLRAMLRETGVHKVKITPADAKILLGVNGSNRNVKKRHVTALSRIITEGHWEPYASMISVDVNGSLIDGQHRLLACVAANLPIEVILSTGQTVKSRFVVDTGAKRSLGDSFTISGIQNANKLAAGLEADSAILKLRDYISRSDRREDRSEKIIAIMVKCWNNWREGKPMRLAHIRSDEQVPAPK